MSQSPYAQLGPDAGSHNPNPYGPDLVPLPPARTSVLAIIALVFSICGCVCPILPPVAGPIAMLFGGISILLMSASNWRIRGVGIATTAICLGLLQIVIIGLLFFGVYQPVKGLIGSAWIGQVDRFMAAAEAGDTKAALAELSPRAQASVTPADISDFVTRYHAEVGKYKNAPSDPFQILLTFSRLGPAMNGLNPPSSTGRPQDAFPVAANFEKTQAVLAAQIDEDAHGLAKSGTGAPASPPFLNIGILTVNGRTIWMIDPDKARQFPQLPGTSGASTSPPPPATAPNSPRGSGPRHPRIMNPEQVDAEVGAIRMTNLLPFGLLEKDVLHELRINGAREITAGGPSKFDRGERSLPSIDRALAVQRFAQEDGKTLVQIRMDATNSRFGLASDAAEDLDLDKPLTIIDDHDKATPAIGFVSRIDKHEWIAYNPGTPLKNLHETGMPAISRDHPGDALVLLFQVDTGSKIAEIRVGDRPLVKFDPPLEAKRAR